MSKILIALQKARRERNWNPPLHGKLIDLLIDEQEIASRSGKVLHRSRMIAKQSSPENGQAQEPRKHIDERLVALHQTHTAAMEFYRKLYVEIVRAGHGRELRTLLISSALAEEGKTTTALNLAITMASGGGLSVLLVETDFRKPSVQKRLGTCSECGLTDYLLGDVEYSQIFAETQIPGLKVVHAGKEARNPTALITSQRTGEFFKRVKAQAEYSYIILDSSPILLTAETSALMLHVDAAILVVSAGRTPRDMVTQAIATLGPEQILGCILNGITPTDSYYYRYCDSSDYHQR